jgi:hypothetical protein
MVVGLFSNPTKNFLVVTLAALRMSVLSLAMVKFYVLPLKRALIFSFGRHISRLQTQTSAALPEAKIFLFSSPM